MAKKIGTLNGRKASRRQRVPISERQARRTRHVIARFFGVYSHECQYSFVDNTSEANPKPRIASEYRVTVPSGTIAEELPSFLRFHIPTGVKVEVMNNRTYRLTPS